MNSRPSLQATETTPSIRVESLSKRYGHVLALDDVSLSVETGSLFALIGPNGAGKSTLIDILCTIRQPDSGAATVAGIDVRAQPLKVRTQIGVVFQEPTLDTRLSVRENMEFHGLVYRMPRSLRRTRLTEMLELAGLTEYSNRPVRTLSSGLKRRLEIARALMHSPRILFLDEPTVGLDAQARARMWDYLRMLRGSQNLTVVVTTHYIEEVEACDRVCIIDHGRILADGPPAELKAAHGAVLVRARPLSEKTAEAIRAGHADAVETDGRGDLLFRFARMSDADALLAEFGDDLDQIVVHQPSLESVFLSLTGRSMREEATTANGAKRNGR